MDYANMREVNCIETKQNTSELFNNVYKQKHMNCNRYFQMERVYKLILFIGNDK